MSKIWFLPSPETRSLFPGPPTTGVPTADYVSHGSLPMLCRDNKQHQDLNSLARMSGQNPGLQVLSGSSAI